MSQHNPVTPGDDATTSHEETKMSSSNSRVRPTPVVARCVAESKEQEMVHHPSDAPLVTPCTSAKSLNVNSEEQGEVPAKNSRARRILFPATGTHALEESSVPLIPLTPKRPSPVPSDRGTLKEKVPAVKRRLVFDRYVDLL